MRIDLHVHTNERSGCAISGECEQIESAIRYGLDAIVITDHGCFVPKARLEALNRTYHPFRIFTGIEITTAEGEDVICLGVHDEKLQRRRIPYATLHRYARQKSAFLILCHPFRYHMDVQIDVDTYTPDAIEIHSTNIGHGDHRAIKALAAACGCGLVHNSDAHATRHVGMFANELAVSASDITTDAALVRALRTCEIRAYRDKARVTAYNAAVRERENLIRKLIKDGKTADDYQTLTGNWSGYFDRVKMGKTYEI